MLKPLPTVNANPRPAYGTREYARWLVANMDQRRLQSAEHHANQRLDWINHRREQERIAASIGMDIDDYRREFGQ